MVVVAVFILSTALVATAKAGRVAPPPKPPRAPGQREQMRRSAPTLVTSHLTFLLGKHIGGI